jgi:5'-nucleotidase
MSFEVAEKHGAALVARLITMNFGPGMLMNVNFPDCRPDEVQGIEVTRQGKRDVNLLHVDERTDMRGNNYYWLGFKRERGNPPAGTDLWAVFNRRISVTPLHMNLTQLEAMDAVRAVLDTP